MALEEGDPGALRQNVLHLLLKHPEGVRLGDFTGAFYQMHGYHPHICRYGYRSLKHLVADMKNVVVVEGDSQRAVLKIANGFHFDHWLEGGGENGLDSSEGEAQSLTDVEKAGGDADCSSPAPSLDSDFSACSSNSIPRGLTRKNSGSSSPTPSLDTGFSASNSNAVPQELVTKKPDLSVAMVLIWEILERLPHGLKVTKLNEAVKKQFGIALGTVSSYLGYEDVISCLQDIPGLRLKNSKRTRNCVVQLQSYCSSPAPSLDSDFSACSSNSIPQGLTRKNSGSSSPTPSLDTGFSASNSNAVPQELVTKNPDAAAALLQILEVLGGHPLGLNIKDLKENLEKKHGFDLETFSQDSGYEDVIACLLHMPGISCSFTSGKCPHNFVVQLLSGSVGPPPKLLIAGPSLDKPLSSSGPNMTFHELMETNRAVLDEVLALVTSLLSRYKEGLRITKLNEILLATEKVDLEQFSISHGIRDTLELLEHLMPELNIRYREDRLQCVVSFESASHGSSPSQFSASLSMASEQSARKSETLDENVLDKKPVSCSSTASQCSASLSLETQLSASKSRNLNQNIEGKKPAPCSSTPSQSSVSISVDSEHAASKSKNVNQSILGKKPAILDEVLALVTSLLSRYKEGLRVTKLNEILLATEKVDLEQFSISQGFRDTLELLEHRMPELNIRYREGRLQCVVSFESVLDEVLALVTSLLSRYKEGLRVSKLNEILLATEKVDLEQFSISQGFRDTLELLEHHMPELNIRYREDRLQCVVSLESASHGSSPSQFSASLSMASEQSTRKSEILDENVLDKKPVSCSSTASQCSASFSLETQLSASKSKNLNQNIEGKTPAVLDEVLALVTSPLSRYKEGLRVSKLNEILLATEKVDLEQFSISHGFRDTLELLEHQMPELNIRYREDRLQCVVSFESGSHGSSPSQFSTPLSMASEQSTRKSETLDKNVLDKKPVSCSSTPSQCSASLSLETQLSSSKSKNLNQNIEGKMPAPCSSTPSQSSASISVDSEQAASKSKNVNQSILGKKPAILDEVLALVTSLLSRYKEGLRVTKLNEILLATEKVDLEQFSISQGFRDTLELLEHRMPELNIRYREDRLQCVVSFESAVLDEVLALVTSLLSRYKEGLRVSKLNEILLATEKVDLEQFSISQGFRDTLELLEHQMPELNIRYREDRLQCVVSLESAVLSETLALVTRLLTIYKEGLRVLKVNEILLATEKLDLKLFSITQGYKDTLELLEHRMPELNIRYREDRLQCVVFLGSGKCKAKRKQRHTKAQKETTEKCPVGNSIRPLSNAPVQFLGSSRMAEPVNSTAGVGDVTKVSFTFGNFPTSSPHLRNLAVPAASGSPPVEDSSTSVPPFTVPDFPSLQPPRNALADNNPSKSLPDVPPRWPSICPLGRPPPAAEAPRRLGDAPPSESSLTQPHPPRDLNELERQVAGILAAHPEGMSLFQFRAAYSAAYQQHLPLGNASSAKQRLLEMPNVVCVKGNGVQTLLLPVPAEASPVKSGQPVFSKAENAATLPGHSLLETVAVAKSGVVLKPSPVPKGLVVPQPRPVCVLASDQRREPGDEDCGVLPEGQSPRAPKLVAPWQEDEHGPARVNSRYRSVQPDLSDVATVAPGHSLPASNPVLAPKSCLKSSLPKLPVPQPCLSFLQSPEYSSTKESHPYPEPQLQGAPKPLASVQQQVRTTSKLVWVPFAPQSPVISPTDSQATRWGENAKSCGLESQPAHLPSPWVSVNSAPSPSIPQPVPANFAVWKQPVVYHPVQLLPKMTKIPPLYPAPFLPVSGMPFQFQVQQTMQQSFHCVQLVPPIRPAQPVSVIQSNEQRKCIHTVPGQDPLSHGQKLSRNSQRAQSPAPAFSAGTLPVSTPSRNKASICTHKSQMVHQPECCNHTWLDDLQHSSSPVPDKSCMFTLSDRIPSKPPASTYPRQYDDMNCLLTSPSKLPFSSQSVPTKAPEPLNHTSSSTDSNSNALPSDPSAFMHQQQYTNESPAVITSSRRPANLLPSPLDSTTSPSCQLLHVSSINSNSDDLPSESQTFSHQQHVSSVSAAISLSTKPAHSPPSPQDSTTNPSRQPSCAPLNVTMDYGAPNQVNTMTRISIPADDFSASFSEEQMPYYSTPQNSPPPRSFDRCVIL